MTRPKKPSFVKSPKGRYLTRFTLSNVRTFRSPVTLNFCNEDGTIPQWTVILGENGTGKTTLLQYLAGLTLVPHDATSKTSSNPADGPPNIRPLLANPEWLSWCAGCIPRPWGKPAEIFADLEVSERCESLHSSRYEASGVFPLNLKLTFDESDDGHSRVSAKYTVHQDATSYSDLKIFAYGAGRHVAGSASPYVSSDSFFQNGGGSPVSTIFHDDYPLISPEQWILGLDHASRSEGKTSKNASQALESAKRCLSAALPNVSKISVKPFGLQSGRSPMTLLCDTPYGTVPFGSLSVGYRTMAAWLTDFVKRMHEAYPDLNEPDDGPAVVLIDEFDLHMHPQWQREAMTAISKEFPNTQFIVTAHSPIVVQATEGNAKLVVLRRKKRDDDLEEVEIIDNPEFAAGWRLDQIMESVYGMPSRMPEYSKLVERRIELLQKTKLTNREAKELEKIETDISKKAAPQESEATKWLFEKLKTALGESETKND